MPLQFRKEYRIDGSVVRCRKRPTGLNKFTYEMRYRRDGYNVTATAKSLEECKAKFLAKLKEADKQKQIAKTVNFLIAEAFGYFFEFNISQRVVSFLRFFNFHRFFKFWHLNHFLCFDVAIIKREGKKYNMQV